MARLFVWAGSPECVRSTVSSVAERLWDRIDPYLAAEGVELDDVEVLGGGQILRVTVDSDEAIGVDTIADLSRGISRILDDEDPFKRSYTLEVSSPGLERKLTRPRHYEKSVGREGLLLEKANGARPCVSFRSTVRHRGDRSRCLLQPDCRSGLCRPSSPDGRPLPRSRDCAWRSAQPKRCAPTSYASRNPLEV